MRTNSCRYAVRKTQFCEADSNVIVEPFDARIDFLRFRLCLSLHQLLFECFNYNER